MLCLPCGGAAEGGLCSHRDARAPGPPGGTRPRPPQPAAPEAHNSQPPSPPPPLPPFPPLGRPDPLRSPPALSLQRDVLEPVPPLSRGQLIVSYVVMAATPSPLSPVIPSAPAARPVHPRLGESSLALTRRSRPHQHRSRALNSTVHFKLRAALVSAISPAAVLNASPVMQPQSLPQRLSRQLHSASASISEPHRCCRHIGPFVGPSAPCIGTSESTPCRNQRPPGLSESHAIPWST
jgi:hypothetical protein